MSLQKQITLILLVVIILFAGLDHAVQRFIVFPRYREIDRANATGEMKRSLSGIDREIRHLDELGQDWATREDLAMLLASSRIEPEQAGRLANELTLSHLDFCYLLDRHGAVVWESVSGFTPSAGVEDAILRAAGLTGSKSGVTPPEGALNGAGLLPSDLGVLLVSAHVVRADIGRGEGGGTCLVGRFLNKAWLQELARQGGVLLTLQGCDCDPPHAHGAENCPHPECEVGQRLTAADRALLVAPGAERPVLLREQGGEQLACLAYFPDLFGRRTIQVQALIPMPTTTMGRDVLHGSLLALLCAGLLIGIVLREAIKMSVLQPISLLTRHAVSLRSSDGYASHISSVLRSRNELGVLAKEFDSMVERLARARRQLVEQSYYSGMTEVASGVMHSLRNALTPITANLDLLREEFRDLPLEQMKMAGREISGSEVSPERREMLTRYLRESLEYLAGVMADAAVRLKGMDSAVAAIEKILAEQEKFTGRDRRSEPLALPPLVREAGGLLSLSHYSGIDLVLAPSLAEVGPVEGRRHALLHIITNLISNAIEAILRAERTDGRIEIQADTYSAAYPGMVHVTVADNGSGIAREDLERIFERGYTTKEQDSSGLGLHWCANTIAAMRGRLYAESDGPGRGAVLHLLIPRGAEQRKDTGQS